MSATAAQARLWAQKWRWYERNSLPWNRAQIHWLFLRREAFARWPVHGNVLEALRERRLEIGAGVLLEPGVWITAPGEARVRIGSRVTSRPRTSARPRSGVKRVVRIRTAVVFPAPLGPRRPRTVPVGTSRDTPSRAWTSP